jgi:hypothetical protein
MLHEFIPGPGRFCGALVMEFRCGYSENSPCHNLPTAEEQMWTLSCDHCKHPVKDVGYQIRAVSATNPEVLVTYGPVVHWGCIEAYMVAGRQPADTTALRKEHSSDVAHELHGGTDAATAASEPGSGGRPAG